MPAKTICLAAILVLSNTAIAAGQQATHAREGFDRLKRLAGTWSMAGVGTRSGNVTTYRLTGDGKTLIQDEAGQLTVFTLDGDSLTLIHYCARGNQPRMRMQSRSDTKIAFAMYDITNLTHPHAYHTTSMELVFVRDDRVDLIYRGVGAGRVSTQVVELTRRTS